MKIALSLLVLSSFVGACATSPKASDGSRTLAFGCEDVVVIGRLTNGDYEHVEIEDDLIGHGWISAELAVHRVVKGELRSRALPVRYFAHTYMRDDQDFMLVLSKTERGAYEIATAHLMSANPRPAPHCE